jgi:ferredoxin--NADP+ reductase
VTLRVAVVGSGPAGFYAAGHLLDSDLPVEVDMIERLPTPWGLVRLGVAPDHPKIKAVSKAFERIAARPGFRFLGGVEVGRDLAHDDLVRLYDAVVYAVGAQTDRRMGIPGEDLPGSWAATELVAWYNGHPDYQELEFDLSGKRAVVVGAGNVALDVVRMLALSPEEIRPTDTTDEAIEAILGSGIEEIVLLARRGPAQAAFTTPELKELGELADADVIVDPAELELDAASEASLERDTKARRNVEVLREYGARSPSGKQRTIRLRFCVSPVAILGEERVEGIEIVRNRLVADESGRVSAEPTDERETIPCGIVFRSVGYLGVELPGVPFDARRATIPNENGRVTGVPGVYCAGWIKRGPSGVIGTNKKDATETIDLLLEDAQTGLLQRDDPAATAETVEQLLADRGVEHVTYAGWEAIDEEERGRGEPHGRPRVKLVTWDDLRAAARSIAAR